MFFALLRGGGGVVPYKSPPVGTPCRWAGRVVFPPDCCPISIASAPCSILWARDTAWRWRLRSGAGKAILAEKLICI